MQAVAMIFLLELLQVSKELCIATSYISYYIAPLLTNNSLMKHNGSCAWQENKLHSMCCPHETCQRVLKYAVFNHDMCHLMYNSYTRHDGHASGVDLNCIVSMENNPHAVN